MKKFAPVFGLVIIGLPVIITIAGVAYGQASLDSIIGGLMIVAVGSAIYVWGGSKRYQLRTERYEVLGQPYVRKIRMWWNHQPAKIKALYIIGLIFVVLSITTDGFGQNRISIDEPISGARSVRSNVSQST